MKLNNRFMFTGLIALLINCGCSDNTKVKEEVVRNYISALSNQDYDKLERYSTKMEFMNIRNEIKYFNENFRRDELPEIINDIPEEEESYNINSDDIWWVKYNKLGRIGRYGSIGLVKEEGDWKVVSFCKVVIETKND